LTACVCCIGCWYAVVGGHVEENESLKESVKREFREETGLDVAVGGIITGRIEKTVDKTKVMVAFEVASDEVEIRLNSKNEAFGCLIRFLVIPFTTIRSSCQSLLQ
jgi:ADP-ribose pyrophosphatase YjhB (NUDIX family)